jgi:tetratricopeptide (TPR) repeat protein
MKKLLLLFLITISCLSYAQNLDSLWKVFNDKSEADTSRLKAIHEITWSYRSNKPDTAISLAAQELLLAQATRQKKYEGKAFNTMGVSFMNKSNYPKAVDYYLKALKINEEIKDKQGIGLSYNNIGVIYYYQSDFQKALEYYLKALKTREEIGNKKEIASSYGNIGIVYQQQSDFSKALQYFFKALKLFEETGMKQGIGACYANIGIVYAGQSDYSKALEYDLKSLRLREEIGDKKGIGICYTNMGGLYNKLSNYKLAVLYSDSAITLCKELGDINEARYAYENLATAYSKTSRYKEAYENHVKFKHLTDSIFNEDNSKQLGDLKTQFEVEKKEAELKIKAEAQETINAEGKKKQQIIIYSVAGVLLVVIVFSMFLLNRFRITQRQKKIIEEQKVLVDKAYESLHEKNKEVIDSIFYARKIQRALITSEKYIQGRLSRLIKK